MKTLYTLATALLLASGAAFYTSYAAPAPQQRGASASVTADARDLMDEGDYTMARRLLENHLTTIPKSRRPAQDCYLLGVCDYELGYYEHALPWLQEARDKGLADADLYLGRLAFLDYDFAEAGRLYAQYASRKGSTARELEDFRRELGAATRALSAVEQITVIDSLAVDAPDFFRVYRLSPQSGRILSPEAIPFEESRKFATTAFANERGDFMMWAEPDSLGTIRLAESIRLTDGSWHEPVLAPLALNGGGDADFPFMMPDGMTLYFASDGEGSMGGLDIFVASRDAGSGEYLEPRNMGMPYNSPYDDYMLAIDELNGIGWWATDRNLLGDKVTVYVYRLNDVRRNLDPERPDLMSLARLEPWQATLAFAEPSAPAEEEEDADTEEAAAKPVSKGDKSPLPDVEAQREAIASMPDAWDPDVDVPDFTFPLPGGRVAHFLSDFKSSAAQRLMKEYISTQRRLQDEGAKLDSLRRKYHASSPNVRQTLVQAIAPYEAAVQGHREALSRLRSDIIKAEKASPNP